MQKTDIQWADYTWNPVRGCSRTSPGCLNCYAEHVAGRFAERVGITQEPRWTGVVALIEKKLDEPRAQNRGGKRFFEKHGRYPRVFVNSMSDLFHESLSDCAIDRVFEAIDRAEFFEYLILTKRSERMRRYINKRKVNRNVWLGVSVENQEWFGRRSHDLMMTDHDGVKFISAEPLLGPIVADGYLGRTAEWHGIDWVIAGGESGDGARRCELDWIRHLMAQCFATQIPIFVKQLGANVGHAKLMDSHGGNPNEWPEDLVVRKYPKVST